MIPEKCKTCGYQEEDGCYCSRVKDYQENCTEYRERQPRGVATSKLELEGFVTGSAWHNQFYVQKNPDLRCDPTLKSLPHWQFYDGKKIRVTIEVLE